MYWPSKHPTYTYVAPAMAIRLGIDTRLLVELAVAVRLFVELGDVSIGTEDAIPEPKSVKVGETELPSPAFEPIAVVILPEGKEVVTGTTTSTRLDVRKHTLSS